MADRQEPRVYSIPVRLRRTTVEEAYILVPVTKDLLSEAAPRERRRLDGKKVFERAKELSASRLVHWYIEEQATQTHPLQKARQPEQAAYSPIDLEGSSKYLDGAPELEDAPAEKFVLKERDSRGAGREASPVEFRFAAPVLLCRSLRAAMEFYDGRLGFTASSTDGTLESPLRLMRGKVMMTLVESEQARPPAWKPPTAPPDVNIWVNDVDALYEEFQARLAPMPGPPRDHPDGIRTLDVRDPNGYVLRFNQYSPPEPS